MEQHYSGAAIAVYCATAPWVTDWFAADESGSILALNSTYSKPSVYSGNHWWADGGRNRRHARFLLVQIINTILSYFVMIKPVLGSSYRQYILSLWLPFISPPTLVVSSALGIVLKGQLALGMLLAVQIAAGVLAFVVMIVLSRHSLVVEVKRQFCRSENENAFTGGVNGCFGSGIGCRMRRKTPYPSSGAGLRIL